MQPVARIPSSRHLHQYPEGMTGKFSSKKYICKEGKREITECCEVSELLRDRISLVNCLLQVGKFFSQ